MIAQVSCCNWYYPIIFRVLHMQIHVAELAEGHQRVDDQFTPKCSSNEEMSFCGPVAVKADIEKIGTQVRVTYSYKSDVQLQCARCLREFDVPVQGYGSVVLSESEGILVVADEDGNEDTASEYYNSEEKIIDIDAVVHDDIVTAVPMMPLCSETCKGLIGKRKEVISPDDEGSTDPRWAALEKLRKKSNQ